jgi:hypothetical protein
VRNLPLSESERASIEQLIVAPGTDIWSVD